jgi:Arc/MetJ family transcription regulator
MARTRVSTTVDDELLTRARDVTGAASDSALLDSALRALLDIHRRAEIDRAYAAYDEHPVDDVDEWGDLASFRSAAAAS